jgi:pyruvate/2-oxoglutarate dehydrogenase complex dihydrolipoamide acyltransferase (E2) component
VAILSLGRVGERPVVREGEIVVRPVGTIAITFDHRVVDGARAAEFGLAVIDRLQQGETREPGGEGPPGSAGGGSRPPS